MFHQEEERKFEFSYDRILQSGMTTKDFIAPTSFLFKSGKDFQMGDTIGAVSYLNILAPELTDKVLAEFLDMDKNLVVSIHVQSVDQLKAIKLIKGKITDLDRMKIEEQKKAVRSGYDMEIIPSDLATYGGEAKKILDDLQSRNERMFLITVLFLNNAGVAYEDFSPEQMDVIYSVAESGGELEDLLKPEFPPEQMQLIADVQNRTDAISRAAAEEALEPLTQQPMTPAEVNHARRKHNLPLDSEAETELPAQPKQEPMNFRITDDDLGAGGPKAKYKANVEAIRVLQTLDAEQRQAATAEEQEILSRYVGWGGIPQAFDEKNKDSVEDREQAVEALKEQIQAGDIQPIREWLQVAVEESEGESAEKAAELITRLDALVKEQKLLSGSEKQFGIYQITAHDPEHDYRFMNLDFVKRHGMEVNRADYELVYTEPLTEKDTLEAIYERFNIQRPTDFTGHSLSVSDVVVLNDGKSIKACYVDSIGFAELPDFFKERKMDLKKETILDEQLQEIEIFDKPGLFSNSRLRDEDVPDGLYRYDLRGSDYDPGQPILVEKTVIVNHAASVLMAEELDLGAGGRLELGEEGLNFTGGLLTVRKFMKEQEEKNNGLLHGDSDHITVEGHVGTWYVVDETEVGGEKFFLLEHEEYGDEAACVAVNEQGKLVAEDLWNGFDEDFQDAVKEYFAEKNPASQKEEQAVPVVEKSRTDDSDVPVYYESFGYAAENGEVDLYRISRQLNEECRNAIEEAIADNFDGMNLADDATKSVVEQFGMERMGYILAYTLNYNNHDGRYSHSNKEWADTTCKGERGSNIRTDWIVRSHPTVLNGFVDPPLMEKPMNQKPSLHQMEHYQKFYENGEYVRAVESTTEQNYNMIDGCANNLPKPRIRSCTTISLIKRLRVAASNSVMLAYS